ncbi:MAG: hypothetical protein ACRDD8_15070 [Bacteroidales bacterium]
MKTNLNIGSNIIGLSPEFPLSFIYFEITPDPQLVKEYTVEMTVSGLKPTMDIKGFMVNKCDIDKVGIFTYDLSYSAVAPLGNNLRVAICVEQIHKLLSGDVNDNSVNLLFKVINKSDNSITEYTVEIVRNFKHNGILYVSNNTKMVDDDMSHMLLRTNPKLSGNIKLVVSPSYDLYLDTFAVTPILAKKEVRKKMVSSLSSFSVDVYTNFSKIPFTDIFALNDYDTYDIALPKSKYEHQYPNTYHYGARVNSELYEQKYNLLAPLWLNNKLPDYFVIFKVDGTYNNERINKDVIFDNFLKNGKIVKYWSLSEDTPLGLYLHNHMRDLKNINNNVFLSLDKEISNTWSGIKDGVLAEISETAYEFDKISNGVNDLASYQKNNTELNSYITSGFSRNNVICPYLINLQFNFDDEDADDYTMSRYFGLYLSANELFSYNVYNSEIINQQGNANIDALDVLLDVNGNIKEHLANRIFATIEGEEIRRIHRKDAIILPDTINKTKQNNTSVLSKVVDIDRFLSLSFNDIKQGEHFDLCFTKNDKEYIFSAITVDNVVLNNNTSYDFTHTEGNTTYVAVCCSDSMSLNDKVMTLSNAFNNMLNDFDDFECVYVNNKLSFICNDESVSNLYSRYISSHTLQDISKSFTDELITLDDFRLPNYVPNIKLFGLYDIPYDDNSVIMRPIDMGLYAIYGSRVGCILNFIDTRARFLVDVGSYKNINIKNISVYKSKNNYYRFLNIKDVYSVTYEGFYVENPYSDSKCLITENKPDIKQSLMMISELLDMSFNIFGILPIKDFDFNVYGELSDNYVLTSPYVYNRDDDYKTTSMTIQANNTYTLNEPKGYRISSGKGYIRHMQSPYTYTFNATWDDSFYFNTFYGFVEVFAETDITLHSTTLNQIQAANKVYDGYEYINKSDIIEEDIKYYKVDNFRLKHGLTTPYICKWGLTGGTDCRSNKLQLKSNRFLFQGDKSSTYSNFIPVTTEDGRKLFYDEIGYPTHRYLDTSLDATNSYVYYDINDVFIFNDKITTLKDLYLNHNSNIDVFSKIIFSSFDEAFNNNKTSVLKYNKYYDTLDTVFKGVSMSFKLSNAVGGSKLYDKYLFSLVISKSENKHSDKPFEIFINKKFKNILIVWYIQSEQITYTDRYNQYLMSKNFLSKTSDNNSNDKFLYYYSKGEDNEKYNYTRPNFNLDMSKSAYRVDKHVKYDLVPDVNDVCKYLYQDSKNILSNNDKYAFIFGGDFSKYYVSGTNSNFEIINNFNGVKLSDSDMVMNKDSVIGFGTFGDYNANNAYIFNTKYNVNVGNVGSLDNFKTLSSNPKGFEVYIIDEYSVTKSSHTKYNNVVSLTINDPKLYNKLYTHTGWYSPIFKDMVTFYNNEIPLILSTFKTDLNFSNTRFKSLLNFEQLWFHKVKSNLTSEDIKTGEAIDFRNDFSPISAQWDKGYYVNYDSEERKFIDGWINPKESSAFFSSKLLKMPKMVSLNKWDANTVSVSKVVKGNTTQVSLNYNISEAIRKMYYNDVFVRNWYGMGIDNLDNVIIDYIDESVLPYYKILDNIQVNIYVNDYNGSYILYDKPENLLAESDKNFNTKLYKEYDNYIYNINVPDNQLVSYYIEIILK